MDACRNHELRIAKHRPRKIVREHLGPDRAQRNRRNLLCRAELRIDFLRSVSDAVAERWESGLEDTGLGAIDGHGITECWCPAGSEAERIPTGRSPRGECRLPRASDGSGWRPRSAR